MSLELSTKNVIKALEDVLAKKSDLSRQTQDEMVESLTKHSLRVLDDFRAYKKGTITPTQYSRTLLKLAEITLMAMRQLPK